MPAEVASPFRMGRGRQRHLLAAAATLVLVATGMEVQPRWRAPGVAASPHQRPNVVFWLVDTLRADRLGTYGYDKPTSPFIDTLAARGLVFERCYAQAPWTKPSMAALLTARYPAATGMFGMLDRLADAVLTMPEVIAAAGYDTAAFSANPIMGRLSHYEQGFQTFHELWPQQEHGEFHQVVGSAAALLPAVEEWLVRPRTAPFFLYLHTVDPHEEYRPDSEYLNRFADPAGESRYRDDWAALRQAHPDQLTNRSTQADFERAAVSPQPFVNYGSRLYDADILATDRAMSSLFRTLHELGLDDNLLLVITSDHGEEFLEHGGTSHGFSLHDELLHVPFLLWGPGIVPQARIATPTRSLDIFPTLLELLGIPIPSGLDGESLLARTRSVGAPPRRQIFAEKRDVGVTPLGDFPTGSAIAVVDWPWKYILNLKPPARLSPPERQLFDLARDSREQLDVGPQYPSVAARLDAQARRWHAGFAAAPDAPQPAQGLDNAALERLRQLGYATTD